MERFSPFLKTMVAGALVGAISLFLFIKINPQLQGQPKQRIAAMRASIDDYFDRRARIFTSNQITDRFKAINTEIINIAKQPGMDQQSLLSIYNQLNIVAKNYNEDIQRNQLNENQFHLNKSSKYVKDVEKLEGQLQKLSPNFTPKSSFVNWVKVKHNWPTACELVLKRIAMVDPASTDRYYGTFGSLVRIKYNFLDGLFGVLGIIFCALLAWKQWKEKKQFYTYGILLLSFVLIFYGNVDFVWQDWPRYVTPIFPLYSLVIAVGIYETFMLVKKKLAERKTKTSQPAKAKK